MFIFSIFSLQIKVNVLDKNDSPPVFRDEPIVFTVSEDLSPGHSVGTIKATDPDTIGALGFALIGGDDKKFVLDKSSGILKLVDTLDRESKDLYKLNVRVSDGEQNTDTIVSVQVMYPMNKKTQHKFYSLCKSQRFFPRTEHEIFFEILFFHQTLWKPSYVMLTATEFNEKPMWIS